MLSWLPEKTKLVGKQLEISRVPQIVRQERACSIRGGSPRGGDNSSQCTGITADQDVTFGVAEYIGGIY